MLVEIGEPGFEPGTSRSQTVRAAICAIPRETICIIHRPTQKGLRGGAFTARGKANSHAENAENAER